MNQPLRVLAARHDLRIGTAVDSAALAGDVTYQKVVAEQFDTVTAENVMKWQVVEPRRGQYDWAAADRLLAFADANDQRVRGHTLVWHNQLPAWLADDSFTAGELRTILRRHIVDQVTHFRSRIWQWDVVNEAIADDGSLRENIWLRTLGPEYIADAFGWAHEADPDALLFYNDYNIEGRNPKSDAVHDLVARLRADGVPVHGVGIQGHLGVREGFPGDVSENIARFAALGLAIAATEVDVRMPLPPDEAKIQAQAEGYRALLRACLLAPRCLSFTVWGFTDRYQWVPELFTGEGYAAIYDARYAPKPAYRALQAILADGGAPATPPA